MDRAGIGGVVSNAETHTDNQAESKKDDVLIVGGGLAGLAASLQLIKAGKRVTVLEADKEVGGKCRNWNLGEVRDFTQASSPVVATNVQVAVGGSYYNPQVEVALNSLIEEVNLSAEQFPPTGVNPSDFPPFVYPASLDSQNSADYTIFTEACVIGTMYPVLSHAPPHIQALQRVSVEDWLASFPNATETAKDMVRDFVMLQMSIDATLQDAYSFAQYAAQVVPFDIATKTFPSGPNAAFIYQLSGGTGRLVTALETRLASLGVVFHKETFVSKIDQTGEDILVHASQGHAMIDVVYKASKFVIVTTGPRQVSAITFHPPLGDDIRNVVESEQVHDTVDVQIFAFFRSNWWFDLEPLQSPVIVPSQDVFRSMHDRSDAPRIMGVTIAVPPLLSAEGSNAQDMGVMRIMVPTKFYKSIPTTLHEDVLAYFAFFSIPVPPHQLMDVKVYEWKRHKRIMHHGFWPTNVLVDNLQSKYLQVNGGQVGRVLFAGTETAKAYVNLMEGAALSGNFAASRVLAQTWDCSFIAKL